MAAGGAGVAVMAVAGATGGSGRFRADGRPLGLLEAGAGALASSGVGPCAILATMPPTVVVISIATASSLSSSSSSSSWKTTGGAAAALALARRRAVSFVATGTARAAAAAAAAAAVACACNANVSASIGLARSTCSLSQFSLLYVLSWPVMAGNGVGVGEQAWVRRRCGGEKLREHGWGRSCARGRRTGQSSRSQTTRGGRSTPPAICATTCACPGDK